MIAHVVGEMRYNKYYGTGFYFSKKSQEQAKNNIKKLYGTSVKCLNDGKEFESIGDASRHYNISYGTVQSSLKKGKSVHNKIQDKDYQFVHIEKKRYRIWN